MSYDVKLKEVARLSDHTHFDIPKWELGARRGPFPFYGDLFERFEVDDYGVDAPSVIFMAAAGKVVDADGFRTALEHGRCGSNGFAHVVVPHDPADAAYIHACLAFHPHAIEYVGGANQLQTLDELAVLRIELPWPARPVRDAFVARLAELTAEVEAAREAHREVVRANGSDSEQIASEAKLNDAVQRRVILVRDLMEWGVLGDFDCTPTTPQFPAIPVPFSDARAERAKAEVLQKLQNEAAEKGGIAVGADVLAALGPLAGIVETDAVGLTSADVAWELGPLAVMRACASQAQWDAVATAAEGVAGAAEGAAEGAGESADGTADGAALVAALDALMAELAAADQLLTLLPNLSYQSSVLAPERLARWCTTLSAIDPAAIEASNVRAVFDLAQGAPAVPTQVASLVAAIASAQLGACESAGAAFYLADAAVDCLADVPALADPAASHGEVICQCRDTESLLAACLVRAVAVRGKAAGECPFGAVAPAANALVDDCFAGKRAAVSLCEVAEPLKPWADKPPHRDDPRWTLGVPTRMRPTFAWLQHILSHTAEGGIAVALIPTSELQTVKPVDCDIRARIAGEGRAVAVVTLPARIWGDGRPPMSLVFLRPEPGDAPCLMVDASRLDASPDLAALNPAPQRTLASGVAEDLGALIATWVSRAASDAPAGVSDAVDAPAAAAIPHRVVAIEELAAAGGNLAPWHYLAPAGSPAGFAAAFADSAASDAESANPR